jgi:hypothetical protein
LIHRDVITSLWPSRDFHLLYKGLRISMGSPVAVVFSGKGLPYRLKARSPSRQSPIQGFGLGSSKHHSIPRISIYPAHLNITSSSNMIKD